MYRSAQELVDLCNANQMKISQVVIENECKNTGLTEKEVIADIFSRFSVMQDACTQTLEKELRSVSGLTGGDAKRLHAYIKQGDSLCGAQMLGAVSYAMSCFELNTAMGCIVAAPTAGSCGILPGVLLYLAEKLSLTPLQISHALATASGIGQIIVTNATVSGAEGGCQAECGSASAMAAAAAVEMLGGTVEQSMDAAAITLKNVMGLVCDPVAGLVEIPCEKRNAIGVANALLSADLVMAGIRSNIPFDETVEAMYRVGKQLPAALRETALGGIAITKTGICMRKQVFGE